MKQQTLGPMLALLNTALVASSMIPQSVLAAACLMHPQKTKSIAAATFLSMLPSQIHSYWLAAKLKYGFRKNDWMLDDRLEAKLDS